MSTIKVNCPDCGFKWLPAERVVLTVGPGGSSYRFECDCGARDTRWCSQRIAALLAGYVKVDRLELEEHEGPPITKLDVFAFYMGLAEPDWLDELVSQRRSKRTEHSRELA